jgi:hypothetical protein
MLPFVFINVATTADGKLAPANRKFVPFSSRRDQQLLLELRTRADAVMAGARTVDLMPVKLGPGDTSTAVIASGIAAGAKVVVEGADRLRSGTSVTATASATPAPASVTSAPECHNP